MVRWTLSGLLALSMTNVAGAFCPLALGLPLLFGTDAPVSGNRPSPPGENPPIFEFQPVSGFEEAQEPPSRADLAKECLKAWRLMIADGRFDIAPAIAAKAVVYDPDNLDARHAVVVSQALRDLKLSPPRGTTAFAAQPKSETAPTQKSAPSSKTDLQLYEESSVDPAIVQATLNYMFPDGLLGQTPFKVISAAAPTNACRSDGPGTCGTGPHCQTTQMTDAPTIRQITATHPANPAKRVNVNTAGWRIECDRIARMDSREMVLEGDVTMSLPGRDVTVRAGSVRVNLTNGTIDVQSSPK